MEEITFKWSRKIYISFSSQLNAQYVEMSRIPSSRKIRWVFSSGNHWSFNAIIPSFHLSVLLAEGPQNRRQHLSHLFILKKLQTEWPFSPLEGKAYSVLRSNITMATKGGIRHANFFPVFSSSDLEWATPDWKIKLFVHKEGATTFGPWLKISLPYTLFCLNSSFHPRSFGLCIQQD